MPGATELAVIDAAVHASGFTEGFSVFVLAFLKAGSGTVIVLVPARFPIGEAITNLYYGRQAATAESEEWMRGGGGAFTVRQNASLAIDV